MVWYVRLSVCHTPVAYSGETARRILKKFSPLDNNAILLFPYQTVWNYSDVDSSKGSVEYKEYEKSQVSTNISLYIRNDTKQSQSYHGRRIGTVPKLSNVTSSMTSSYV